MRAGGGGEHLAQHVQLGGVHVVVAAQQEAQEGDQVAHRVVGDRPRLLPISLLVRVQRRLDDQARKLVRLQVYASVDHGRIFVRRARRPCGGAHNVRCTPGAPQGAGSSERGEFLDSMKNGAELENNLHLCFPIAREGNCQVMDRKRERPRHEGTAALIQSLTDDLRQTAGKAGCRACSRASWRRSRPARMRAASTPPAKPKRWPSHETPGCVGSTPHRIPPYIPKTASDRRMEPMLRRNQPRSRRKPKSPNTTPLAPMCTLPGAPTSQVPAPLTGVERVATVKKSRTWWSMMIQPKIRSGMLFPIRWV